MIGSHLLDELLRNPNNNIVGIDNLSFGSTANIEHNLKNPKFNFYEIDIFDVNTLGILTKDVDIIVHLAAVKKIDEKTSSLPTLTTNVIGTENIYKVAFMWN